MQEAKTRRQRIPSGLTNTTPPLPLPPSSSSTESSPLNPQIAPLPSEPPPSPIFRAMQAQCPPPRMCVINPSLSPSPQGVAQNGTVSGPQGVQLQALVASVMVVISHLVPTLKDHVAAVIKKRWACEAWALGQKVFFLLFIILFFFLLFKELICYIMIRKKKYLFVINLFC